MAYLLERSLFIARPREEVFAFFSDAVNLERITPPFLRFHILTPGPISMKEGTLIDYELRLFGLPFRWRTLIESFNPISSFIDVQLKGPYRTWLHRHEFEDVPGGTQMHDRVEYELPFGWIGNVTHALFVRRSVEQIFTYRNAAITGIFGGASN
jgi:ligand-binding SRPBCC domain-containing protein